MATKTNGGGRFGGHRFISTIDQKPISSSDDIDKNPAAKAMFDVVNKSGTGMIDQSEFFHLYQDLHRHVRQEHERESAQESQIKTGKKRMRALGFIAMVSALLLGLSVGGNAIAMFAIVEKAKDTKPDASTHELRTTDGDLITTGDALSYTPLFDLPAFDTSTLTKIRSVTLQLTAASSTFEATLTIVGAIKQHGQTSVTLHAADGSRIYIDSTSNVAMAHIDGKTYIIDATRRRALASKATPRMYSEDDFFVADLGFEISRDEQGQVVRRRLSTDSHLYGFAAIAVSATRAILDATNSNSPVVYTSILLKGMMYKIDQDVGEQVAIEVYHSKVPVNKSSTDLLAITASTSTARMTARGMALLTDYAIGFSFVYDEHGVLTECKPNSLTDAEVLSLEEFVQMETSNGGQLILRDPNGTSVIAVESYEVDPVAKPSTLVAPTPEACAALGGDPPGEAGEFIEPTEVNETDPLFLAEMDAEDPEANQSHFEGRHLRHWSRWGRSIYHGALLEAAMGSYGPNNPWTFGRWRLHRQCATANAYAKFLYKSGVMVLAFAGTDKTDFMDWRNNLNIWYQTTHGITTHAGFFGYQNSLAGCVNREKNALAARGIPLSYIVGHSLGGSAATIYSQLHGQARHGLVTFGAPKTRYGTHCSVPGTRYAHESDPAAGNLMGYFGSFRHDVTSAVKLHTGGYYCTRRCWWSCCPWAWARSTARSGMGCTQESGGCSWSAQCIYNFATSHPGPSMRKYF